MGYQYKGNQPEPKGNKPGPVPTPFDPHLCGTPQGYKQHVKFREEKCQPCRDAYAAYQRELRARKATA